MRSIIKRRRVATPDMLPGDYAIDPEAWQPPGFCLMTYDGTHCDEELIETPQALTMRREEVAGKSRLWVDLQGLGDDDLLQGLAKGFGLHPLALEDIVHVTQRAKAEPHDGYLLIVLRMPTKGDGFCTEQLSIVLGDDWLLTFQEQPGDVFERIRERLRGGLGRIRKKDVDYLAYSLIDAVVDAYFPILERVGDRIDAIEDVVMEGEPGKEVAGQIHALRREVVAVRRAVWPLRDALYALTHGELELVSDETQVFMRDAHDHILRILDMVESYRETIGSLMDTYLSSVSNRMNEIMQVLTVIATLFIPLTFVAGLYGMNFDTEVSPWNMPETKWYWGYPFALALMAGMTIALLVYFRRKGWLGGKKS